MYYSMAHVFITAPGIYVLVVDLSQWLEAVTKPASVYSSCQENGKACEEKSENEVADLTGEYLNICLLLVLYTLQGIPMGISGVLPLILKD
eukprot:g14805.t1